VATKKHASGTYTPTEPLTGRPAVPFAEPILADDGSILAVIGGSFDIEAINQIGSATTLPAGAFRAAGPRGDILFRSSDWERLAGTNIDQAQFSARRSRVTARQARSTGRRRRGRLYGYKPLVFDDTAIASVAVGGFPLPSTRRSTARCARTARAGIEWHARAGAAWAIGDLFVLQRVRALLDGTRAVARGDYGVHIPQMRGNDELPCCGVVQRHDVGALRARAGRAEHVRSHGDALSECGW
jgi:hypothetical protein